MRKAWARLCEAAALLLVGACAATGASAYLKDCNCSVYLGDNARSAIVIENTNGWIWEPYIVAHDGRDEVRPVLGMTPHVGKFDYMRDCSRDGVSCARLNAGIWLTLAFKPGEPGARYTVDNVSFQIERVFSLPHRGAAKLYSVTFSGPRQIGRFVYSDAVGIISIDRTCGIRDDLGYDDDCKSEDSIAMQWHLDLVDGPGLLSPQAYPAASAAR